MLFHFTVKGFQSVRKPVRVTVEGYCTIEGESNLGKSAFIRALHAALSNRVGNEFIPDNVDSCEVTIESAGHVLKWEKDRKATHYTVDGQELGKSGRGVIPEEAKLVGISAIRTLDKVDHWPQIHFQWEAPFIIGAYTDTVAAELLGASAETAKISRAIKLVNSDVAKGKTRVELLELQYKEISSGVQVMEELAGRINASQQVVDNHEQEYNGLVRRESTFKDLVYQYRTSWSRWKIIHPLKNVTVSSPPDCTRHKELSDLYQRYTRTQTLIDLASRNQDTVPVVPKERQQVTELVRLYREALKVSQQVAIFRSVAKPAVMRPDVQVMTHRIQTLKGLRDGYLKAHREVESSSRVLGEISQELRSIEAEKKKLDYVIRTMEKCPLCEAPMRDGKFCVEETHGG